MSVKSLIIETMPSMQSEWRAEALHHGTIAMHLEKTAQQIMKCFWANRI